MRDSRTHQPLTYDVRLPDEAQEDALRLLDASRAVVNAALAILWSHLDEFATDRVGPPGNRWANTSEAHPRMVIDNGDVKVKW